MLKLMLIQRNGVTTHRIIDDATRFENFVDLVHFENFDNEMTWDESKQTVTVARTETTYTMLTIEGANEC